MSYTVSEVAKISGVSVRAIHWYDEIGLVKPAWVGANGYRHYEEEQLLLLQQVLFFRELGFKLDAIQEMLGKSDFDKLRAPSMHKQALEKTIDRTSLLVDTIEKNNFTFGRKAKDGRKGFVCWI